MIAVMLFGALLLAPAPAPKILAIVRPTLQQYEDGPPLAPTFNFLAGESVFFSFHIQGYQVSPDSQVDLRCQVDAVDPQGVKLVETLQREIKTQVSAEDKDWMPIIRQTFLVPPLAGPGQYHILVSVEDKLSRQSAKLDQPFTVRGRQVEPSPTLVARNFRFLRSEEDQQPLTVASYRPGDTLWARFDIVGYKYGEKNRVQVEYGLAVLGPTGKTLYTQPKAAEEQGDSFYPKHYLPGVLSLNLEKNAQPGTYTIVLTLHDGIGSQTDESRHEFRIEQ